MLTAWAADKFKLRDRATFIEVVEAILSALVKAYPELFEVRRAGTWGRPVQVRLPETCPHSVVWKRLRREEVFTVSVAHEAGTISAREDETRSEMDAPLPCGTTSLPACVRESHSSGDLLRLCYLGWNCPRLA